MESYWIQRGRFSSSTGKALWTQMVNSENLQQVQHNVHFRWKMPPVRFDLVLLWFIFCKLFCIYKLLFHPKVIQTSQGNGIGRESFHWKQDVSHSQIVYFSRQMLRGLSGRRGLRMRQQSDSEDTFLSWNTESGTDPTGQAKPADCA